MSASGPSDASLQLGQAIASYLYTLPLANREATSRELGRFARWIGNDTPLRLIRPADVGRYQESLPESSVDINQRLEPLKAFLTSLKTNKLTDVNLAAHVRLRRTTARRASALSDGAREPELVRMTEAGHAALTEELHRLEKEVRPQATEELARARADGDFRENAPYDAAKQKLGEVQGRINEIRAMLSTADIHTADSDEIVDLGMTVALRDLAAGDDLIYTVVGPGEMNLREGKISAQSPVGKALMNRRVGDVVEVTTPAGAENYRIERIERRRDAREGVGAPIS